MADIAIDLLEKVKEEFQKKYSEDKTVSELFEKIEAGTATHDDAYKYAGRVGTILTEAYGNNISSELLPDGKMWYNIADRVITPTMHNNYEYISEYVTDVQQILNNNAGIGIKPIVPEENKDRIRGIVDRVSEEDDYDKISWILNAPVKTAAMSVVDDSIKANAEFHAKAGMSPQIIRKTSGNCCDWCSRLAGTYSYPDVPKDVYKRHNNCDCTVEYNPGNGKKQNVWSKQWKASDENDKIGERKTVGLIAEDDAIKQNIRKNIISQQNIEKIAERQQIHRIGTDMYEQRKIDLKNKGQYGPSYVTISDEEILELVKKYSGKGDIKYDRKGQWDKRETIVTNTKIVGVVINNKTGKSVETSVFKIHYGKDGIHIVPDYPSKKR